MSSCHIEDGANNVKEEGTSNAHISTHIGENLYSCNTCSKNFNQNSQLVRHLKIHTGLKIIHVISVVRFLVRGVI